MAIMNIDSPKGTKIKFTANGGYDKDKISALKILRYNKIYTVDIVFAKDYDSRVRLKEFPNNYFNICLFEKVENENTR
jgi:hypothetical protein